MRPDGDTLRDLLAAGLLAPSAENKHDLRFEIASDHVGLVPTDRASWGAAPHREMLTLMSFGAVVENIALQSAQHGLVLVPELRLAAREGAVASLRWREQVDAAVDPLAEAIPRRHTNRRFYARTPVDAATLAALARAAGEAAGGSVHWLAAPDERRRALHAIRLAETERFKRRALHAELFGAVRFEAGWQRTLPEWLAPATLEVEPPARPMFSAMRHWGAMRAAAWVGAPAMLGLRAGYLPCALAPHLGAVLAQGDDDAAAAFAAGRAFQRLWLAAAAAGLALQPMAAATALARQHAGGDWVSAPVQQELRRLLATLGPAGGTARPYMLFRLGRARAPSAVAGRRPLDDYLGGGAASSSAAPP
ncbi:MAG: nitroreductase family protein [Pseudomonadota bacterium]